MKQNTHTNIHVHIYMNSIKQTHIIQLFEISCPYVFSTMKLNSIPLCFRSINTRRKKNQQHNNNNNRMKLLKWMNILFFFIHQYRTYRRNEKKKPDFFSSLSLSLLFLLLLLIYPKSKFNAYAIVNEFFSLSSFQKSKH